MMHVLQRLQREGVAVAPDCTVRDVAEIMDRSGVGTVAVVDGDDLVGIVTDRDIVRRAVARGLPPDARIDGVMSAPVHTVEADAELSTATAEFGSAAVRRLVVVDDGRFVGVLSLDDILVDLAGQLAVAAAPLVAEIAVPHRDSAVPATVPLAAQDTTHLAT
jgi:CBS domain-containing protein